MTPDRDALTPPVGAVLAEQYDEWAEDAATSASTSSPAAVSPSSRHRQHYRGGHHHRDHPGAQRLTSTKITVGWYLTANRIGHPERTGGVR
jgi:hypothetical protein